MMTRFAEEARAADEVAAAETLAEKLKSLKESKSYLSDQEVAAFRKQQESKINLAAALNAKIQPLMKVGNPDQVALLAEAVERLRAAVGGSGVQTEADDEDEDDADDVKEREMENEVEEREMVGCAGCEARRKRKGLGFFWRMFGCRDVRVACTCDRKKG